MAALSEEQEGVEWHRMQRVKVYRLNSDGLWDDKGTGHVSVEYLEVGLRCIGSDSHRQPDMSMLCCHKSRYIKTSSIGALHCPCASCMNIAEVNIR